MRGDNPELHLFIRGLLGRKIALEWTGFGWKALLECQWVPVEDLMIRHSVVNLALIRLSRSKQGGRQREQVERASPSPEDGEAFDQARAGPHWIVGGRCGRGQGTA
ncbi:MAG TPA: hypothetical protein VF913_04560 [Xanthobacteraceae bacterium]